MKIDKTTKDSVFANLVKQIVKPKQQYNQENFDKYSNFVINKKTAIGEIIPTKVAGMKNKILLYKESGKIEYICLPNVNVFKPKPYTNAYRLLRFLIMNSDRIYTYSELNKIIRTPRSGADYTNEERRIRDTVSEIRKAIGSDIFYFNQGVKLSCYIEIR